jgi:hypothetical protein
MAPQHSSASTPASIATTHDSGESAFPRGPIGCENPVVDQPKPRRVLSRLRPWLSKRWVQALLVLAAFAVLAVVFMVTSERKDSSYWAGYADGQRWVDEGGYQAHEASIAAYCRDRTAARHSADKYQRGCVDGAHNAMK